MLYYMRICAYKHNMEAKMEMERLSDFYKMFADSSRLKIIECLNNKELSVNEIVDLTKLSQTAVSHQLRILRDNHVVKFKRQAQQIFYSIDDEHISKILDVAIEHLSESA